MKIAFYCDCNSRGGVFVYTVKMAGVLLAAGCDVIILTHAPRDALERELFGRLEGSSCHIHMFPREDEVGIAILAKMYAAFLEENNFTIFFPNYRDASFEALHWLSTVKSVAVCHNNHESYYKKIFRFDPLLDLVIFPNKSGMEYCIDQLPFHSCRYSYIPHFVDSDGGGDFQKSKDTICLIYFGRIEQEQKAIFEIVKIAQLIKAKEHNWKILVFGDGSDKKKFISRISELQLNEIIKVHDAMAWQELKPKIEGAHFSILTSTYEGFCYSAAESMALGVPLACYSNSAIKDYVRNGENGIVVNWGDIQQLVSDMEVVVKSESKYNLMCEAARHTIENNFSRKVISGLYIRELNSCSKAEKNSCWHFLRPKTEPGRNDIPGRAMEYFGKKIGLWK